MTDRITKPPPAPDVRKVARLELRRIFGEAREDPRLVAFPPSVLRKRRRKVPPLVATITIVATWAVLDANVWPAVAGDHERPRQVVGRIHS